MQMKAKKKKKNNRQKNGYALWMSRGIMQSFYISQKACNISFLLYSVLDVGYV